FFRSAPTSSLTEPVCGATLWKPCCGTSVSEPITEPSIREGMPVRCADECEVPRWRGVNDLLQVGMHRYRELGLRLMLHVVQEPLRRMLPPKADYIGPALEAVEQKRKG